MRLLIGGLAATASLILASMNLSADPVQSLYDLKVNSLEGQPVDLGQYKGHVVLVVNVASKCGFTPQYAGLEKLYLEYKDKGFFILGFPSNDFGHQEPGTPEEIRAFCTGKYNVTFPMFEKVVVKKNADQAPVYQFLTTGFPPPSWNFCKYLIDPNGKVLKFFPSKVKPQDKELTGAIDAALKG
ncbi:MAG TPA: glutathione peroxidase [Candidatus Methylacidiphilales bacterium]|jgi:glutathione peroxidase|nr:glutathione peroxidase [Candidatus Methylacidiphilales bacterium]